MLDFSNKSYGELLELQEVLKQELITKKQESLLEGITKVREIAKQYGLTVTIEEEEKTHKSKKSLVPRYHDHESGKQWSGQGPTPKWLKAYEESGRNREEFAINKS